MKLKNVTAILVVLAMLFSQMTAFGLVAAAEDGDNVEAEILLDDDAAMLRYALATKPVFNSVDPIAQSVNYSSVDAAWPEAGWTATNAEGVNDIEVYGTLVAPSVRVVHRGSGTVDSYVGRTPAVVNLPDYGKDNSYILLRFKPEVDAEWGDIGLRDIDGNLITAFRFGTGDDNAFCVNWGHTGYGSPYRTYFEALTDYMIEPLEEAVTSVVNKETQIDILMRNCGTYYTATYFVDGSLFSVATYNMGEFNGLGKIEMTVGGGSKHDYIGLANLEIYTGNVPENPVFVTASYIYNVNEDGSDECVHEVTRAYDAAEEGTKGAFFDEYYYSAMGSHIMYKVPATYLTEDGSIDIIQKNPETKVVLTRIHNWSHADKAPGNLYTDANGTTYEIATRNLVPNGNFEHSLASWYNGEGNDATLDKFIINSDNDSVIFRENSYSTSDAGIFNKWDVEKGETYLFTYTSSAACETGVISTTDDLENYTYTGRILGYVEEGTHDIVFTAEEDYVQFNLGWFGNNEIGSFGLYKLEKIACGNVYTTVIEGNTPVLPAYMALDTDGVVVPVSWNEDDLKTLERGENTVNGLTEDNRTVTATVMVYPETFCVDYPTSFDGQNDVNDNGGNVKFEKSVTGKFAVEMDVQIEEYGDLWIVLNNSDTLGEWYFHNDQILLGFYFDGEFTPQNGYGDGNREDPTRTLTVAGLDKTYRIFVKGDCNTGKYSVIITSPEGISKTFDDFGFRTNVASIDSVAMFTNSDGTGSLTAENIKVYDPEELNAQYILEDNSKTLGTENIGDYFYGEEITFYNQAKFYTSYTDEETNKDIGHIVKSTMEQKYVVDPTMTPEAPLPVYVKMHKEHAVVYDTFATGNSAETATAENLLFAGSSGISDAADVDDDGNATFTSGEYVASPRIPLLTFNIPKFNEGNVVMLNLYVYRVNHNLGDGDSMKLAVNTVDTIVDESAAYLPEDVADVQNLIWSDNMVVAATAVEDGRRDVTNNTHRVAMDVTDLVMQAKKDGKAQITFAVYAPTAGAYIVNRESAVYGGIHQGDTAAFLEVENDTYTLDVYGASRVTKNGSNVQLEADGATRVIIRNKATMKLYSEYDEIVAFVDDDNTYVYREDKVVKPYASSTSVRAVTLGLAMVNGAQVRYGDKVDENGKVGSGNGLRFITTIDHNDSLADFIACAGSDGESIEYTNTNFTMGAQLEADGSTAVKEIVAKKLQNDDVFTTAITNLSESNFNRNYTATPYIKIEDELNGDEIYVADTSVTRSIYCVATGILKTHDISEENADDYSMTNEDLLNVLRAYVNQVGIRLTYNPDAEETFSAREDGSGAYSNSAAFFDVSYTDNSDGSYTVVVTPLSDYNTNVEIKDWWKEYVRVNNNNSKVRTMITNDSISEDGTLTFTFTEAK